MSLTKVNNNSAPVTAINSISIPPFTTKGGILVGSSSYALVNLSVGIDGYLLTADSTQVAGIKWAPAPVSLPDQTSNSGKYLTTNGSTASWCGLDLGFVLCHAELARQQQTVFFHHALARLDALGHQHLFESLVSHRHLAGFKHTGLNLDVAPMLDAFELHRTSGHQNACGHCTLDVGRAQHLGLEDALGVVDHPPDLDGARGRIERVGDPAQVVDPAAECVCIADHPPLEGIGRTGIAIRRRRCAVGVPGVISHNDHERGGREMAVVLGEVQAEAVGDH